MNFHNSRKNRPCNVRFQVPICFLPKFENPTKINIDLLISVAMEFIETVYKKKKIKNNLNCTSTGSIQHKV